MEWVATRPAGLEEAADALAVDPEADHAARAVDLVDRVRGNHAAAAREEPGLDRKGVRDVGSGAVHGALDLADEAALPVGDDVAGSPAEIDGESTHVRDAIPALQRNKRAAVKGLLNRLEVLLRRSQLGRHTISTTTATMRRPLT